MELEQLRNENEHLKSQISRIFSQAREADEKIKQYEMQLNNLQQQNLDLVKKVQHLEMNIKTMNRKDESKYY
jgi:chromosome segregation ATPase